METLNSKESEFLTRFKREGWKYLWAWHRMSGLIIFPLVFIIALSGALYLFHREIDDFFYNTKVIAIEGQTNLDDQSLLDLVKKDFPEYQWIDYTPPIDGVSCAIFQLKHPRTSEKLLVWVNPYNGRIQDYHSDSAVMSQMIKSLHGKLFWGSQGEKIVEAVACMILIMICSGLCIAWKKADYSAWVFLGFKTKNNEKSLALAHRLLGTYSSCFIGLFVITGLPWTSVIGKTIKDFQKQVQQSSPPAFGPSPYLALSDNLSQINLMVGTLKTHFKTDPATICVSPQAGKAYVIRNRPPHPKDRQIIHIDPSTGTIIKHFTWKDFPMLAKWVTYGISLHEGTLFGAINLWFNFGICLALIFLSISGMILKFRNKTNFSNTSLFRIPKSYLIILIELLIFATFPTLHFVYLGLWFIRIGKWFWTKKMRSISL